MLNKFPSGSLSSNVAKHDTFIENNDADYNSDSASDVFSEHTPKQSLSEPLPKTSTSPPPPKTSYSEGSAPKQSSAPPPPNPSTEAAKAAETIKDISKNLIKETLPIIDTLGQLREILKLSNLSEEALDVIVQTLTALKKPDGEPLFKNELEAKKFLDEVKQGGMKKVLKKLNWRSDVMFSRLDTTTSRATPNNPMLKRGLYKSNNSFYKY